MIMKQEINSNLLAECMKEAMKVEFLETNEEIKPVSYTHLDVYKRQVWHRHNAQGGDAEAFRI